MIKRFLSSALMKVLRREVLRIASSNVLIFTTILAPVVVFLGIQWMFSVGVVRDLPLTLVDLDQSNFSRKVARMIDATPVATIAYKAISVQEAQKLMNKGKTDGILIIPANTEQQVLKGESPELNLFINNTNLVKGGILKSSLYKTITTISAGIKLQVFMKQGSTESQAMEKVMPIRLDQHVLFNPFGNYVYFLALGLLPVMLTVFTFLGSVYALGIELKDGTAGELMKTANENVLVALTGKFMPYTFLYFMSALLMNMILFKGQGTPINGNLYIVLFSELVLIVAYQALAVLFLNITSNLRLSLSLGSAYTMMALSFSGLTFPTMAMPFLAKVFGFIFPYTMWLKVFMSQTLRGEPIRETLFPMLMLGVYFLTGMAAFPGMKKKLMNPLKWGKD